MVRSTPPGSDWILVVAHDISERIPAQDPLRQSERLSRSRKRADELNTEDQSRKTPDPRCLRRHHAFVAIAGHYRAIAAQLSSVRRKGGECGVLASASPDHNNRTVINGMSELVLSKSLMPTAVRTCRIRAPGNKPPR